MQKQKKPQGTNSAQEGERQLVWMRISEAAERLGCDPATVRRRYRNPNYPYRYQRRRAPDGSVEYGIPQEELDALRRYEQLKRSGEKEPPAAAPKDQKPEELWKLGETAQRDENELLRRLLDEREEIHRREVARLEERIRELRAELDERRQRVIALERRLEELEERFRSALHESAKTCRELAHQIATLASEGERSRVRVLELSPGGIKTPRPQTQIEEKEDSFRQTQERREGLDYPTSGQITRSIFRLLRRKRPPKREK